MPDTVTIVLVDDHSLVRNGIKSLLQSDPSLEVIAEASNGNEAITLIKELQPDIAIVDIKMPGISGIETIKTLSHENLETKYIVLSMHDSKEYVLDSIKAGAHGYLLKDIEKHEFTKAIHNVAKGEQYYAAEISSIVVNSYLDVVNRKVPEQPQKVVNILTPKEKEIMQLALSGLSNKGIAESLNKSIRTVETHRFNLMKKLNARNLAELYNKAQELGLLKNN